MTADYEGIHVGNPLTKKGWLLIIRSSTEDHQEYSLKSGLNTIGREADNDIILQDTAASNHHAEIYYHQNKDLLWIHDLKSTNGTFINGKRLQKPQSLQHEDQIRIGHGFISIINTDRGSSRKFNAFYEPTKVTGGLILESVDQFGILLHEVGQRLIKIPDLDTALNEITDLIKRMIGAEKCQILLEHRFDFLNELGIPDLLAKKIIANQTATIFSNGFGETSIAQEPITQPLQSMMLVPVVTNEKVVALIFAKKSGQASNPFNNTDLQLVLAVSNQVAMSIQRNLVEGELIHKSYHDSLTGLPNRTLFLERLNRSIARSKQKRGFEFAVLFFDIDDFKDVNDSLGHFIGDRLLIAVAERLKHNVKNSDLDTVIARFGGDEFAVLLDDIKGSLFALATANRLKEILSKPFTFADRRIFSTVSIGVAVSTIGYEITDDILRDADMAMYKAKELGKNRVEIYDTTMHERVKERMRMGTALRQGALQKEFQLHYQPIISLKNSEVAGFEALVRWYTSDRGILNPADFFYAIDTAGLVYSTDSWVLHNACRQAAEWQDNFPSSPPLFISVNLSAKNIKHPNLIKNINNILQVTKLDPMHLHLEITEKVSTPNDESAIEVLKELRSIGIQISLDDFGTGYSALNYLAHFPIDILKIDRSFIKMIGTNDDSHKIIEMIKTLANHLGLIIIAEGIENAEQISFLKSIDCEYGQGYYYAKPMDTETATKYLENGFRK